MGDQEKLTGIKIKQDNGQYSNQIPVGALAENVAYNNQYSVKQVLGNVDVANKGTIQQQLDARNEQVGTAVSEWMSNNIGNIMTGDNIYIDPSLSVKNYAADAQATGKLVTIGNETTASSTKVKLQMTDQSYDIALMDDISEIANLKNTKANAIHIPASGTVVSFQDGADNMVINSIIVEISPIQDGAENPSPNNIRPLTGYTKVNIAVSPTLNAGDGKIYTTNFGEAGTVYTGTLDINTGQLTVTHIYTEFNGTETWELYSSSTYPYFRTVIHQTPLNSSQGWCSHFSWTSIRGSTNKIGIDALASGLNYIVFRPGNEVASTVSDLTAWLATQASAETPLQVIYPLLTPIEYTLTPIQIYTLLGVNNIWANTGNIQIEYTADTKLYIDNKLNELITQIVNS